MWETAAGPKAPVVEMGPILPINGLYTFRTSSDSRGSLTPFRESQASATKRYGLATGHLHGIVKRGAGLHVANGDNGSPLLDGPLRVGLNLPERAGFASGMRRFEGLEGRANDRALLGQHEPSVARLL